MLIWSARKLRGTPTAEPADKPPFSSPVLSSPRARLVYMPDRLRRPDSRGLSPSSSSSKSSIAGKSYLCSLWQSLNTLFNVQQGRAKQKQKQKQTYREAANEKMGQLWTFFTHLHSLSGPTITLLYPLYASVRAIESPSKLDDEQWLAYWILYYFLTLMETMAQPVLQWIPIWYQIKVVFVAWLVLPHFRGASFIYERFVRGRLRNYDAGGSGRPKEGKGGGGGAHTAPKGKGKGKGKGKFKFISSVTTKKAINLTTHPRLRRRMGLEKPHPCFFSSLPVRALMPGDPVLRVCRKPTETKREEADRGGR